MIDSPIKIFISCSWQGDLKKEKVLAEKTIKSLSMKPVSPTRPSSMNVKTAYCALLSECDLVVVILGKLYRDDVETEFRFAFNHNIPTLVFQKKCKCERKLQRWVNKTLYAIVTPLPFKNPRGLKIALKEGIIGEIGTFYHTRRKIGEVLPPELLHSGIINESDLSKLLDGGYQLKVRSIYPKGR
jgi:hypothetical protein